MARHVAGVVLNLSAKGLLVKAPQMVPIGTKLVDVRSQPAGRVADVLGPVKAPYLLVVPGKGVNANRLIGREVYTV